MKHSSLDDRPSVSVISCVHKESSNGTFSHDRDALALSLDIQKCESWSELAALSVHGLCYIFGAVEVRWLEITPDGKKSAWSCFSTVKHTDFLNDNLKVMIERSDELGDFHQSMISLTQKESDEVNQFSTSLSAEARADNSYVQKFMKPMGVNDIVSMPVIISQGGIAILSLSMPDGDFSDEKMNRLKFLGAHIKIACTKLSRLVSLTNLAGLLKELRQPGKLVGISVISSDGEKLWETDSVSKELLKELGRNQAEVGRESGADRMPKKLSFWVKETLADELRLCPDGKNFTKLFQVEEGVDIRVRLFLERAGSGALLVLERDKGAVNFGAMFTRRERDVIGCIQEGMPSHEVSESLSISKRTVDKHLENIYMKLGVKNRLAAVKRLQSV